MSTLERQKEGRKLLKIRKKDTSLLEKGIIAFKKDKKGKYATLAIIR